MKKSVPIDAQLIPDTAQRVYSGQIFDVYQWPQELYDGSIETFEMLKRPDTTQTLAVVDGKIIVVTDEQPNRGPRVTFPGGRVDTTDTDTQSAAAREVVEETGYSFEKWKLLGAVQPVAKLEWFIYVYLAWGDYTLQPADPGPGEKIHVDYKTLDEVQSLIAEGTLLFDVETILAEKMLSIETLVNMPEYTGRVLDR